MSSALAPGKDGAWSRWLVVYVSEFSSEEEEREQCRHTLDHRHQATDIHSEFLPPLQFDLLGSILDSLVRNLRKLTTRHASDELETTLEAGADDVDELHLQLLECDGEVHHLADLNNGRVIVRRQ